MNHQIIFDAELLRRYDKSGPRYTSYPTAVQFHTGFTETDYREQTKQGNITSTRRPLSLYFHLPFCDTVCFYCACNKVVTKDRKRAAPYLEHLHREIAMQAELFDRSRPVEQLHWGGGTPTFISHEEMHGLMEITRKHFLLRDDDKGEYGIEVDPREIRPETLSVLRKLGFNRLSMGVQDFDPRVQKAVNRIQGEAETIAVLNEARALGFRSINMDLIYGLPFQTVESFGRTLEKIIASGPDRLSVFNYAHLPEMFKPQRRINADDLPNPQEKLNILQLTIERLTQAGYVYIGMDHFARPDDELAQAQRNGTLYRNFQGYSTHAECDLIGMGITAIGMVGNCYNQNQKTLEEYYAALDSGHLPVMRGVVLDDDDKMRREIITQLICHFSLDCGRIENLYGIRFAEYFANEMSDLDVMQHDGLLEVDDATIRIHPAGKLLIRNICMVFDRYLREKQQNRFSKVI
ncbi:MAG: oxygen-independent coproporphyrinogen III oxidase [Gammaproteobacteria bacterium]|nr:oxygen-independent coproporphyrinogen III oxidase [Gammaproteobacteria bacterium]MDH3371587.1 oxygen-independent coproporphyrinogen III oxidase [Gammaproteobacteria bacterium]MDH3405710.1 oxygen-independent coproporphyrinogen III oxidase [Gammaproteobacteria bacterium]MDH3563398.1 oxygen-independent coproporphyrinogen III oxidase [Gammaproteobacteria bacterium]MDH5486956.1 oxygen-independent coproporphyrinogen III oxidase [Gammaproteobacteria bacterium]